MGFSTALFTVDIMRKGNNRCFENEKQNCLEFHFLFLSLILFWLNEFFQAQWFHL